MSNYELGNHINFTEEVFLRAKEAIQSNPSIKTKYINHPSIQELLNQEEHDFPVSDIWSTFHLAYEMMEGECNIPIEYRLCEMEYGKKENQLADGHAHYYKKKEGEDIEDVAEEAATSEVDLKTTYNTGEYMMKSIGHVVKYGFGKRKYKNYVSRKATDAHIKYFHEAYVNEYVYGESSTAKEAICAMLEYFSYADFAEELVRQLHRRMYMCKIARDLRKCSLTYYKEISWRNKIDKTWLRQFCNDVVTILDLKANKIGEKESVLDSWKMIEDAAITKWGKNSNVAKCLKKKCHFCYSYDPQSFEDTVIRKAREQLEVAKNQDLKNGESNRLKAEWKVIKEEQRKKDLLKKEEQRKQKEAIELQKRKEKEKLRAEKETLKEKERAERLKLEEEKRTQKGAVESVKAKTDKTKHKKEGDVKKGAILVPFINREIPKSKFIMIAAGISAIIAIATTVPILMLNKKTPETAATANELETKDAVVVTEKFPPLVIVNEEGEGFGSTTQQGQTFPPQETGSGFSSSNTGTAKTSDVVKPTDTTPKTGNIYTPQVVVPAPPTPVPIPQPELIEYTSNFLGVTVETSQSPVGVRISEAPPHGLAYARHGIRTGDVITEINGVKINTVQDFKTTFEQCLARDGYLAMIVQRGNSSRVIRVYK